MALPSGITPKTVQIGIASFFDGTIANGRVTISAPVNVIHTPTNRPIFSSDMTQQFVDGVASFNLCPSDAPGLNRKDWTYKLKVEVSGASVQPEVLYFTLPADGPDVVDLDGLVTVPSSAGIPISVDVLTAGDLDPLTAGFVADTDSQTAVALRAAYGSYINARSVLGATQSQWPDQLEAAFAAHPGETFFFPDGDYGLSRGINVTHNNSLILAPNARIYATAATSILINHETADPFPTRNFHLLPQGRVITGGWLDGAGLADTVLRCAVFQGMHVNSMRITDGVHRGLVVDQNKLGQTGPSMTAEGIFRDLHFMQTTDAHLVDNVAIEVLASDIHFQDIIVIDWTTAVRDAGSGLWLSVHCWTSQLTRFPTSVAYDIRSSPRMMNAYSDTYRTGWKIAPNSGPTLYNPLFYVSDEFINLAFHAANPSTVFDLADASSAVKVTAGNVRNYGGATGAGMTTFIRNPTANTNIAEIEVGGFGNPPGGGWTAGGPGNYSHGRLLGRNADFSPTIVGTDTAGAASYNDQTGWIVVSQDRINLTVRIYGSFDNTIAGQLRIPVPVSPTLASVARIGSNMGFPSQLMAHIDPGSSAITLYDQSTASIAGGGSAPLTGEQVRGHAFFLELDIDLNIA